MKMNEPPLFELSHSPATVTVISVMKNGRMASTSKMFMMFLQKSSLFGHEPSRRMNSSVNHATQIVSTMKNGSM